MLEQFGSALTLDNICRLAARVSCIHLTQGIPLPGIIQLSRVNYCDIDALRNIDVCNIADIFHK